MVNICLRQACCKGVTEEKAAGNISTFQQLPSSDMVAVWHDK